jgi:hypothetical protein
MTTGEPSSVAVADQAQFHGVLVGLRDVGAVVIGLRIAGDGRDQLVPIFQRRIWPPELTLEELCGASSSRR